MIFCMACFAFKDSVIFSGYHRGVVVVVVVPSCLESAVLVAKSNLVLVMNQGIEASDHVSK